MTEKDWDAIADDESEWGEPVRSKPIRKDKQVPTGWICPQCNKGIAPGVIPVTAWSKKRNAIGAERNFKRYLTGKPSQRLKIESSDL